MLKGAALLILQLALRCFTVDEWY